MFLALGESGKIHLQEFRLWVPVVKLNLVDDGFVLQRVGCKILDPTDIEATTIMSKPLYTHSHGVNILADTDVPDFTLIHELLELLPRGVRIVTQDWVIGIVGLEGNRPTKCY